MHDTGVIVVNVKRVDDCLGVFLKVEEYAGGDVLSQDPDEAVSVWSRLLMMETNRVTNLVDDGALLQTKKTPKYD